MNLPPTHQAIAAVLDLDGHQPVVALGTGSEIDVAKGRLRQRAVDQLRELTDAGLLDPADPLTLSATVALFALGYSPFLITTLVQRRQLTEEVVLTTLAEYAVRRLTGIINSAKRST